MSDRTRCVVATATETLGTVQQRLSTIHHPEPLIPRPIPQVTPGSCDRSFGIHVARIADFPAHVVAEAESLAVALENGEPLSAHFVKSNGRPFRANVGQQNRVQEEPAAGTEKKCYPGPRRSKVAGSRREGEIGGEAAQPTEIARPKRNIEQVANTGQDSSERAPDKIKY